MSLTTFPPTWVFLFLLASDITLQHVSTSIGPSLTSSAHPSKTSATKFLSERLYSKKRQVAVLASSVPQPNQERNPKKQKKGGLSLETRMLLGLDEPEDLEKEKQKEKRKKKSLLLQAEGQRKPGASLITAAKEVEADCSVPWQPHPDRSRPCAEARGPPRISRDRRSRVDNPFSVCNYFHPSLCGPFALNLLYGTVRISTRPGSWQAESF